MRDDTPLAEAGNVVCEDLSSAQEPIAVKTSYKSE